jgi:hypothetical protein
VITIEDGRAGTRGKSGVIPYFTLIAVEQIGDVGLVRSKLGLGKTKDVSANVFHLEEEVNHVSTIIFESYAVYILEINPQDLFFPDFFGYGTLS